MPPKGAKPSAIPFLTQRKLRKLRRNPRLFFEDAVRNRLDEASELAIRQAAKLPVRGFLDAKRRYTVVSAVYDVADYVDEFVESLVQQTVSFERNVELILVDDGSTDATPEHLERWRKKYPANIRVIRKPNGGQASARNTGLAHVTGDWVTFIDPDDWVDRRYFEQVDRFLSDHEADTEVGLVVANLVFFHESSNRFGYDHPLKYRFAAGNSLVASTDDDCMAPSAATSFFRADILTRSRLYFDEAIRPHFEDGHFAGRYLLEIADQMVGYVADAKYYYRKRAAGTSTLDGSWAKPTRFSTVLERGHLDLLRRGSGSRHAAPPSLQRLVLYDLIWYLGRIVDKPESVDFLTEEQLTRFKDLVTEDFVHIEARSVMKFNLAKAWFFHKVGMLGLFKGIGPEEQLVYAQKYDSRQNMVQLRYFYWGAPLAELFRVDGNDVTPAYVKTVQHDFLGDVFCYERLVWVELGPGYSVLEVELDGRPAPVSGFDGAVTRAALAERLGQRPIRDQAVPLAARALRAMARRPRVRERYRDAWMLLDRDDHADDNAEHLYRWLHRNRPDINAFYVLLRSSSDWDRLEAEGFRLVAFGSREHHLLLLNAAHVVSSHCDSFVLGVLDRRHYGDMLDFRFTFLGHGVTRGDISKWINTKPIDFFVTASPRELESIASEHSPYRLTYRETRLVGLPRHDGLLARSEPTEKVILIMPTWRSYLVAPPAAGSTRRTLAPEFHQSTYARTWKAFLHSDRLRRLVDEEGYQVLFFPHVNVQPYLDWFEVPAWVTALRSEDVEIQSLFRRAQVLVTDYSSVFFDFAVLDKPTLYYQFDFDEMFAGLHPSRIGYFDYHRDGFGPVAFDEEAVFDELDELVQRNGRPAPRYLERMAETLPHRDGRSCERTVAVIESLDAPPSAAHRRDIALDQARRATRRALHSLARERWERVVSDSGQAAEKAASLALAAAGEGRCERARELLERVGDDAPAVRALQLVAEIHIARRNEDADAVGRLLDHLDETLSAPVEALGWTRRDVRLLHASLLRESLRTEEARAVLESIGPDPRVDAERARLELAAGDRPAALSFLDRIPPAHGDDAFRLSIARLRFEVGDSETAHRILSRLVGATRHRAEGALLRLDLMTSHVEDEALVASAASAVAALADTWDEESRLQLVERLVSLGLTDAAEPLVRTGASPATRLARWIVAAARGQWNALLAEDADWWSHAARPRRTRAVELRARAYGKVGEPLRGVALLAADDDAGSAPLLFARADLLLAAERWDEAVPILEQHLDQHPHRHPQRVRSRLVLALERSGRHRRASELLSEAAREDALQRLQADPDDVDAFRQLFNAPRPSGD